MMTLTDLERFERFERCMKQLDAYLDVVETQLLEEKEYNSFLYGARYAFRKIKKLWEG